jgi:hypothetical protein
MSRGRRLMTNLLWSYGDALALCTVPYGPHQLVLSSWGKLRRELRLLRCLERAMTSRTGAGVPPYHSNERARALRQHDSFPLRQTASIPTILLCASRMVAEKKDAHERRTEE